MAARALGPGRRDERGAVDEAQAARGVVLADDRRQRRDARAVEGHVADVGREGARPQLVGDGARVDDELAVVVEGGRTGARDGLERGGQRGRGRRGREERRPRGDGGVVERVERRLGRKRVIQLRFKLSVPRARVPQSIHASRPFREMISRPKISRNEWKTGEIGAFEVGNFALFCCPERRRAVADEAVDGVEVVGPGVHDQGVVRREGRRVVRDLPGASVAESPAASNALETRRGTPVVTPSQPAKTSAS